MIVSLPFWAYIALLAYSLIFTGLFIMAFAAYEAEKRAHQRTHDKLRAEVSYFCGRWIATKRALFDRDKSNPEPALTPDINFNHALPTGDLGEREATR